MIADLLARLGLQPVNAGAYADDWLDSVAGPELVSINPATGEQLAVVQTAQRDDYEHVLQASQRAFVDWRLVPAPQRGELVRRIGLALREHKDDLGLLVTLEAGKIRSEGAGEVQEMIDMCDFAVGLSRQLYGLTIASERPEHRLFEQWQPLGVVGVITAFNFPVAVWAWNALLAAVCGDTVVWKPSERTPLTALAVQRLAARVCTEMQLPQIFQLCLTADKSAGEWLSDDPRVPLLSATGSCAMGRIVGQRVAARLGRSLLELGGNNALIVTESANLDLALRAVLFAAVGTAGQRCTTLRRLIVQESIAEAFVARLATAYRSLTIGLPWEEGVLVGPLISPQAVTQMLTAVRAAQTQGGEIICGGKRLERAGNFVEPTIIRATANMPIVREETFAPLLYVLTYRTLDEAIALQNDVPQGLSSAIFTDRVSEAEQFLSPRGSDCGIANVNIGTSGAEIGGAFGGEKQTGGGREAGSDAWKAYMRRQTCTINGSQSLPLAQGVRFDV
ncbi:MAG TPA: aldehyde dehydrogenase family protein [Pirellulaceae bacterium]|nr:aldehyde dehydrogenase family protein [Pirellulaceae bacterium]